MRTMRARRSGPARDPVEQVADLLHAGALYLEPDGPDRLLNLAAVARRQLRVDARPALLLERQPVEELVPAGMGSAVGGRAERIGRRLRGGAGPGVRPQRGHGVLHARVGDGPAQPVSSRTLLSCPRRRSAWALQFPKTFPYRAQKMGFTVPAN